MYLIDAPKPRSAAPADDAASPADVAPSRAARLAAAGLVQAWRLGVASKPSLDPAVLIERAMRLERLDDFGPDHWREPFHLLVHALAAEADLNPVGRTLAHGQLVKALRERLRAHALWARHPEILKRPITAPIVVLGSMRSGTTRIQRLLACDDRLTHTRLFESLSPVPDARSVLVDRRPIRAAAGLHFLKALNPALAAVHPSGAWMPDEEFGLFSFAFSGAQLQAQWRVPSFARWWERKDATEVYREFRRLMQTIAWSRGDAADRPWVLKAPQFMEELDALLAVFPDARLLCLSRDAGEVVASSCSLIWQQQRVQSDSADPRWIGREWLHKTAHRASAAVAFRRRHPRVPQLDVDFAAVDRDWRTEIGRIQAFLGLAEAPRAVAAMRSYVGGSTAHRGHRYTLGEFGLAAADVRSALPEGA